MTEPRVETRLGKIESLLKELKEQMGGIGKKTTKIETKITEQEKQLNRIEDFCDEFEKWKEEVKVLKAENLSMKNKLSQLENEMDRQEIRKKRNTLEIFGIPKIQNETLTEVVKQIAAEVKIEINNEEIEECYRASDYQGRERPITLKLKNASDRDKLIKAVKAAKLRLGQINRQPENKKIYVNEALIPKKKQLLYKTKNASKDKQWIVWTYKGEIYVKRSPNENQIKIANEEELVLLTQ